MTPRPDPIHSGYRPRAWAASATPTRRTVLGAAAAAAGVVALRPAAAASAEMTTTTTTTTSVLDWINHTAHPLLGTEPGLPARDLHPLRAVVHGATIVGLGESSHGTHDQFALKHRIIRYLVERLGFRTVAWEDAWAVGVAVDRYIAGGPGDPREIVADAGFNLQNEAMLDLMDWLRRHNRRQRPEHRVRFLGADVVQLRDLQFAELERHVAAVDPALTARLLAHLAPLRIQRLPGSNQPSPGYHIFWYRSRTPDVQQQLIEHARAVYDLVQHLPHRPSPVSRRDAELHALTLLGFYEAYTPAGDRNDTRDAYIAEILRRWQRTQSHRVIYSAANAHTVAATRQTISFPPDPPAQRSLAGGRLRAEYGRGYVSVGLTFDHGTIRAGWDTGQPTIFPVPAPDAAFVDHQLGNAGPGDYLLDLSRPAPRPVRSWLNQHGTLRVIGGASYDPANDPAHYMALDGWGQGFDAIVHLNAVEASRLP